MTRKTTIELALLATVFAIGVFIGGLDGCDTAPPIIAEKQEHFSRSETERDITKYAPETKYLPGEIKWRDRLVPYAVHDTAWRERPDSTRTLDPSMPPFTASTTAVFGGDTVGASVKIPENEWTVELRRKADTNTTVRRWDSLATSKTVAVEDKKRWGVGPFVGYSKGLGDLDKPLLTLSDVRIGIGITYHLWEW